MTADTFLIVGLGNPEPKYKLTRHNIGFLCIDALAGHFKVTLKSESKLKSFLGKGRLKNMSLMLAAPTTYMNLSGEAVLAIQKYYQVPTERILIILDDIDLPFGKIRFRPHGSAGSHNGLKSIITSLGTPNIPRLRIGIGQAPPQWDLADYVLSAFTAPEMAELTTLLPVFVEAVTYWAEYGTEKAMNHYNAGVSPAS